MELSSNAFVVCDECDRVHGERKLVRRKGCIGERINGESDKRAEELHDILHRPRRDGEFVSNGECQCAACADLLAVITIGPCESERDHECRSG